MKAEKNVLGCKIIMARESDAQLLMIPHKGFFFSITKISDPDSKCGIILTCKKEFKILFINNVLCLLKEALFWLQIII